LIQIEKNIWNCWRKQRTLTQNCSNTNIVCNAKKRKKRKINFF